MVCMVTRERTKGNVCAWESPVFQFILLAVLFKWNRLLIEAVESLFLNILKT